MDLGIIAWAAVIAAYVVSFWMLPGGTSATLREPEDRQPAPGEPSDPTDGSAAAR
jgi:hypothetical protein